MFHGDKGKPTKYSTSRLNFDIIIDNERLTLQKLSRSLGFYTILFDGKIAEVETVYDTDKKLMTGAGLILRKKQTPARAYFSLVRVSSMKNVKQREKKSFLGECDPGDQPGDFPVQIADEINKIFNNLFTVNLVEIVSHCTPYVRTEIAGNRYKIISGTGYEAEISFEDLRVRDMRTGRKGRKRICSLKMELDPDYERERQQILDSIERHCKELVLIDRNHFEISEVLIRPPVIKEVPADKKAEKNKKKKKKGEQK